jgi:hypothetical protein
VPSLLLKGHIPVCSELILLGGPRRIFGAFRFRLRSRRFCQPSKRVELIALGLSRLKATSPFRFSICWGNCVGLFMEKCVACLI